MYPINLVIWGEHAYSTAVHTSSAHSQSLPRQILSTCSCCVSWFPSTSLQSVAMPYAVTTHISSGHRVNLGMSRLSFAHTSVLDEGSRGGVSSASSCIPPREGQPNSIPVSHGFWVKPGLTQPRARQGEVPELSPDLALPKRYVCLIFLCLEEKKKFIHSLETFLPFFLFLFFFFYTSPPGLSLLPEYDAVWFS